MNKEWNDYLIDKYYYELHENEKQTGNRFSNKWDGSGITYQLPANLQKDHNS